jgi:tryptophan halogenase
VPYAYHFDSALYGKYLRKIAEKAGVTRTEGIIEHIATDEQTGHITGLQLKGGQQIQGDFFIDCTGSRGLLLQKTLGVDYLDWSNLLPANTALAVQTERFDTTLPYTRSIAHEAGWQWRIPLTHRNGNGIVFCSDYLSDAQAEQTLLSNLDSKAVNDVRKISFKTGRTAKQWHKNVVAVGLSSGFLEPLESTSIHLIQSAIVRLLKLFPHEGVRESAVNLYNQESAIEYDTIRDFIILHYVVNERDDSDFWQDMRRLTLPPRLQNKLDVFKEVGAIFNDQHDIFKDASWLQVMMGQGIMPQDFHPAANVLAEQQLMDTMQKISHAKRQPMSKMLPHDDFIKQYVGA